MLLDLAFNGVNTSKLFLRIENDMNDGDEVNDDIPKKNKKEHLPHPKNERKKNFLRWMADRCYC